MWCGVGVGVGVCVCVGVWVWVCGCGCVCVLMASIWMSSFVFMVVCLFIFLHFIFGVSDFFDDFFMI